MTLYFMDCVGQLALSAVLREPSPLGDLYRRSPYREARPGRLVRLELHLVSNCGRPFAYLDFRRADRRGRFELRLPYPTARATPAVVIDYFRRLGEASRALARGDRWDKPLPTLDLPTSIAVGPAAVLTDDWTTQIHVDAEEVRLGRTVFVMPTAASASTPLHGLPP